MSNLSEEEKQAIEGLKLILKEWQKIVDIEDDMERDIEMTCYSEEMPFYKIKTVLNYIDKLQKENEELKREEAKRSWVHIKENGEVEPLFYISEDKIKAKIEELEKQQKEEPDAYLCIKVLRSLLEKGVDMNAEYERGYNDCKKAMIKKIEKIKVLKYDTFDRKQKSAYENMVKLADKLNEVIDKINEMESKK